jgi:16S rRNA pseudouridine516 synthase
MRLDKYLSHSGFGTRTEVRSIIKKGNVKVNGVIVNKVNAKVDERHDVCFVGEERVHYLKNVYLMLNKPGGCVSAVTDPKHPTVIDIIEGYDHFDLHHVGRLDIDTEGLLILTNDGRLTHEVISPKHQVDKIYYARLKSSIDESAIELFKKGITLGDGYECMSATLEILNEKEIHLTIQEGKFHQVKRMFKAIGNEVVFLKRLQIGSLKLDENLGLGEYKELTLEEVTQLLD